MQIVHATTAMYPGRDLHSALAAIHAGVREPLWEISSAQVQLCPQTPTTLTEAVCEELVAQYPNTRFRTHANARVLPGLRLLDLSTYSDDTRPYYQQLADRAQRLNAPAVSLHAGYAQYASFAQMLDHRARIQELFGAIPVAIEGLFPHRRRKQLVDGWSEYDQLLQAGVPIAVDVSHLHIVATAEGAQPDLAAALLASPHTLEVHVSHNDGTHDAHEVTDAAPWWMPLLDYIGVNAVLFSEGNQLRATRALTIAHNAAH